MVILPMWGCYPTRVLWLTCLLYHLLLFFTRKLIPSIRVFQASLCYLRTIRATTNSCTSMSLLIMWWLKSMIVVLLYKTNNSPIHQRIHQFIQVLLHRYMVIISITRVFWKLLWVHKETIANDNYRITDAHFWLMWHLLVFD